MDDTDFEWLMIDVSHVKVHPDAAGAILYHFWYHSGLHSCSAAD